jgi:hypothetical protein
LMVADAQLADTCFLWQIGDVINCLDDELFTESIHAKR